MANYTLNQGETLRVTLELQDSLCNPIRLATVDTTVTPSTFAATVFFAGVATFGTETVTLQFQMQAAETLTYGRGSTRTEETGVYKVYAFIAADDTAVMTAGDWAYEIRQSAVANPVDNTIDSVSTVLEGTITIKDGPLDTGIAFVYTTPDSPTP